MNPLRDTALTIVFCLAAGVLAVMLASRYPRASRWMAAILIAVSMISVPVLVTPRLHELGSMTTGQRAVFYRGLIAAVVPGVAGAFAILASLSASTKHRTARHL